VSDPPCVAAPGWPGITHTQQFVRRFVGLGVFILASLAGLAAAAEEPPALALRHQRLGITLGQARGPGEGQRALADEQHVAAVLEDPASQGHRVGNA